MILKFPFNPNHAMIPDHTLKYSNLRIKWVCKASRLLFCATFQDTEVSSHFLFISPRILVLYTLAVLLSFATVSIFFLLQWSYI